MEEEGTEESEEEDCKGRWEGLEEDYRLGGEENRRGREGGMEMREEWEIEEKGREEMGMMGEEGR